MADWLYRYLYLFNFGYPSSTGTSVIVVPLSQVLILWHSLSDGLDTQLMPLQTVSSNELQNSEESEAL